jgi:hypothetical protein
MISTDEFCSIRETLHASINRLLLVNAEMTVQTHLLYHQTIEIGFVHLAKRLL